jgi:hypothetical protein
MKTEMQKLENTRSALLFVMEALVMGFAFDSKCKTFVLACEYPHVAPGARRAFAAFVFSGVEHFLRKLGNLAKWRRFRHRYESWEDPAPIVVQFIESGSGPDGDILKLSFGTNFGEISFTYTDVEGFIRNARVEGEEGHWIYRDAQTGEVFDFYRPFPELMPP